MKEFFEHLNALAKPQRNDIIEKDYHLHRLLHRLSKDDYFGKQLVFKGGTCLVKAYTGYYRFSEDLDFTWKYQEAWEGITPTKVRNRCSKEVTEALEHLVPIAKELGFSFSGDKGNMSQVIMSSGGRMPRFYLKYNSEILNRPANIKVEINYVDLHLYPFKKNKLGTYLTELPSKETEFLFKDHWKEYAQPITMECYDTREIYTEKARAALTRISYKLRDIIDLYIIQEKYGYTLPKYKNQIIPVSYTHLRAHET